MIRLRLLGGLGLEGPDGALRGPSVQRKRLALLALLALAPEGRLSREKLVAYLWPERRADRARHQLSSGLYELRRAVGEDAILAEGDELRLNPEVISADVVEFEAALEREDFERAAALYHGPLLDGFFLSDAVEFERWLDRERERLAASCARALEALAEAEEERNEGAAAMKWWKARAAHDPYDSRIALRLMLAFEAEGNPAGALQHASIHEHLLRDELGVEPAPEVRALANRLRGKRGPVSAPERRPATGTPAALSDRRAPGRKGKDSALPESRSAETGGRGGRQLHRILTPTTLVGLGAATLIVAASIWIQQGSATAEASRTVVAPFENLTGDPDLDPLGRMASDWIARELSETGATQVVLASPPLSSRSPGAILPRESGLADPLGELAQGIGAAVVVSGAYYRLGDSIQFHVRLSDRGGSRVLRALDPITGPAAEPGAAAEQLGRRVASAVVVVLDTRLAAIGDLASQPENPQAFHACIEGLEAFFASDWPAAIRHFERSMELDSTYVFPLLHIGLVHLNVGDPAAADSIVQLLDPHRERMMPFERGALDLLAAYVAEDPVASYEAARRAAQVGPGSPPHVQWGAEALRLNRPREAVRILSAIDPESAPVGGWPLYWSSLTGAHHALGQHRRELRQARRARVLYPNEPWSLLLEARALAALGRVREVEALVALRRSLPDQRDPRTGPMLLAIAEELRFHGRAEGARDLLEEAIAWYHRRPLEKQGRANHPRGLAFTLLAAERLDEAETLLRGLSQEDPDDVGVTGALGVLAARSGRAVEAQGAAGRLATLHRPYGVGEPRLWRACIAAHRGDLGSAVTLLQEAAGRGARFEHAHFCLDPLRDDPAFREFMRPKG